MSTSFIKILGRTIGGLLLAATGGFVYWELQPIDWAQTSSAGGRSPAPRMQSLLEIPTAGALAKLADQRLRAPLYDPPPLPPPAPKKVIPLAPPRVDLQLIGTMIEKDRSRAVLAAPGGRTEIRGEGETITSVPGEIVVVGVSANQVTLRVGRANGAEVTLTLEGQGAK